MESRKSFRNNPGDENPINLRWLNQFTLPIRST
jgi:hypothetical protein